MMNKFFKLAITYTLTVASIALASNDDLYIGAPVVTANGYTGTVTDIQDNEHVTVRIPGYRSTYEFSHDDIAPTHSRLCQNGLCRGDSVATESGYEGTVAGVLNSGRVLIRIPGYLRLHNFSADQVGLKSPNACQDQVCPGKVVKIFDDTEGNTQGKVIAITGDGTILVRKNGRTNLSSYSKDQISTLHSPTCEDYDDCWGQINRALKTETADILRAASVNQSTYKYTSDNEDSWGFSTSKYPSSNASAYRGE